MKTSFICILLLIRRPRRRIVLNRIRRERNVWVKDIFRKRKVKGEYENLVRELQLGDREMYFR